MVDNKRFKFGFVGGGFNFVYALNLKDAKRRIYEEYECDGYEVRYDSVKEMDDEVYFDLLNTTL